MNGLSWLLYLAGTFDNIHVLFGVTGALSIIAFVISLFVIGVVRSENATYRRKQIAETYYEEVKLFKVSKLAYLGFILIFLSCIIPSKQTTLLIAASEVSEKVLTSEKVQGIIDPSLDLLKQKVLNELKQYTDTTK